jgi:CheY-like chemotaxis protein
MTTSRARGLAPNRTRERSSWPRCGGCEDAVLDPAILMPEMERFAFLRALCARRDSPVMVLTAKDITADDRRRLVGQAHRVLKNGQLGLSGLAETLRPLVAPAAATSTRDVYAHPKATM